MALPTAVGVVLGMAVAVEAGVVGFLAAMGGVVWWARRFPKDVVLLKVERGELLVFPMGSKKESFRVKLDDLDDVVLETRQVERVMDLGSNAINIGTSALTPNIATPTETKRIVLEPAKGSTHALTKEFFGHAQTTEWFAKVRLFLRNTGWTPLAEREEKDDEADEDEDEDEDDDDDDDAS